MTANLTLSASRNIAWQPIIDIFYPGADLPVADATVEMQIRMYPGAPGDALATLSDIVFEDMPPIEGATERRLRLAPEIGQATLAGFPTGLSKPEPGEADIYAYDIIITYADGAQDKLALGSFVLEPGVTLA